MHENTVLRSHLTQMQSLSMEGIRRCGRVSRAVGITLEAKGFYQPIGARCWVQVNEHTRIEAEVVGFDKGIV